LTQPSPPAGVEPASILPSPLLIVEDEPAMQLRLRGILGILGYDDEALSFAGSIGDANALMALQPFAMVLVDVGLPDGNGIDLIRTLHAVDAALAHSGNLHMEHRTDHRQCSAGRRNRLHAQGSRRL